MKKQLIALAASIPLLAISSFPEAKAGQSLFDFTVDGVKWDLKIDKSGSNAGKLFLRKNQKSTKCKQYVFDVIPQNPFFRALQRRLAKNISNNTL